MGSPVAALGLQFHGEQLVMDCPPTKQRAVLHSIAAQRPRPPPLRNPFEKVSRSHGHSYASYFFKTQVEQATYVMAREVERGGPALEKFYVPPARVDPKGKCVTC